MSNTGLMLGADPELFVRMGKDIISAHDMVPGTKAEPHKVDKGAVQVDGMALEFNIDPAKTEQEFDVNIETVLQQLSDMIPHSYRFVENAVVHNFDKGYMKEQPDTATELGCDPDFSAYTMRTNPTPEHPTMRSVSGHVHLGWMQNARDIYRNNSVHFYRCCQMAKQLDFAVGAASLLMEPTHGKDRRCLYGKAGAFRPKKYGVEYRTLSNFWIFSPALRKWVFKRVEKAANDLIEKKIYYPRYFAQGSAARVINEHNIDGALNIENTLSYNNIDLAPIPSGYRRF